MLAATGATGFGAGGGTGTGLAADFGIACGGAGTPLRYDHVTGNRNVAP
jgi:hypothetical protein